MRRSAHYARSGSPFHRSKRRRLQFKNMRRVQHKRRLIFLTRKSRLNCYALALKPMQGLH